MTGQDNDCECCCSIANFALYLFGPYQNKARGRNTYHTKIKHGARHTGGQWQIPMRVSDG